jgi:hypothetical protein
MKGIFLKKCRKVVYLGHRWFLPANYPVRKKGKHFKGKADHQTKPRNRTGEDVLDMVNDVKVIFGKGPAANLFWRTPMVTHPCGRRSPYFGSYPIGKS